LIDAIDNNESSLIEDLCRQGANSPDRPSGLIQRAVKKSNAKTVEALLAHLGNTEERDLHAVLTCAAIRGDTEVLQLLIESIGAANITSNHSMYLLVKAAEKGHTEAVRVIFSLRHTYTEKNLNPCWSPLHSAAAAGHDETVSLILEHPLAHYSAACFDAAVRAAMANGAESTVQLLLERGTCNDKWVEGSTALKQALQKGLDVSVPSLSGENLAILVDSEGRVSRNGFQNAALANDIEKIKRYLQQGADIHQLGGQIGTALQAAASKGHLTTARFLLDQGANATAEGGKYGNALAAATANNHIELVHMLLAAGCNPSVMSNSRIYAAIGQNYESQMDFTPLHWAAFRQHKEAVLTLLSAKADIQKMTSRGYSPLHAAVFRDYSFRGKAKDRAPMIQLLLEHGADAKAKDSFGNTPLHMLVYRKQHFRHFDIGEAPGVAKILVQYGADPDEPNKKGVTPRQTALDADNDVRLRILEVFGSYNERAKAVDSLQLTPTAHAQLSKNESGTKAPAAHSFDQGLMRTTSTSADVGPSSLKLEPTVESSNVYSTGERSTSFTATPPASERLVNPEMDNSLFINPWADEDQQLEATSQQPASVWDLQNCPVCGKEDQEAFGFCSGCDVFLN
jgi:ankyrin repeat protein